MALQNQTPASAADLRQGFGAVGLLSSEQSQQIFQMYVRKAEEERAAAVKRAEHELECMKRESDVRIAMKPLGKDNIALGKIPARCRSSQFVLPVFHRRTLPKSFTISPSQSISTAFATCDAYATKPTKIKAIEDGMLSLKSTEAFINYKSILVSLFSATAPNLHMALAIFKINILQPAKVYKWQEAVLPLAIKVHTHIVCLRRSDASNWIIPPDFQGRFCTIITVLGMSSLQLQAKRKRFQSPPSRRTSKQAGGVCNNPSVSCELTKRGSCNWPGCERHDRKG